MLAQLAQLLVELPHLILVRFTRHLLDHLRLSRAFIVRLVRQLRLGSRLLLRRRLPARRPLPIALSVRARVDVVRHSARAARPASARRSSRAARTFSRLSFFVFFAFFAVVVVALSANRPRTTWSYAPSFVIALARSRSIVRRRARSASRRGVSRASPRGVFVSANRDRRRDRDTPTRATSLSTHERAETVDKYRARENRARERTSATRERRERRETRGARGTISARAW